MNRTGTYSFAYCIVGCLCFAVIVLTAVAIWEGHEIIVIEDQISSSTTQTSTTSTTATTGTVPVATLALFAEGVVEQIVVDSSPNGDAGNHNDIPPLVDNQFAINSLRAHHLSHKNHKRSLLAVEQFDTTSETSETSGTSESSESSIEYRDSAAVIILGGTDDSEIIVDADSVIVDESSPSSVSSISSISSESSPESETSGTSATSSVDDDDDDSSLSSSDVVAGPSTTTSTLTTTLPTPPPVIAKKRSSPPQEVQFARETIKTGKGKHADKQHASQKANEEKKIDAAEKKVVVEEKVPSMAERLRVQKAIQKEQKK